MDTRLLAVSSHGRGGERPSGVSLISLLRRAPLSHMTTHLPKAPPQIASSWGVGLSIWIWENTDIPSIALLSKSFFLPPSPWKVSHSPTQTLLWPLWSMCMWSPSHTPPPTHHQSPSSNVTWSFSSFTKDLDNDCLPRRSAYVLTLFSSHFTPSPW